MNRTLDSRHPIFRQEYAIYTPPMDRMIHILGDWIDQRISGGYIYGPSRFGKSRAVKWYVKVVLEERFRNRVPMVIWVRPAARRQETEFWNLLLCSCSMAFASPLRPRKKLQARFVFKQHLITLARAARQNYVVLIIDEAHDMSLDEWKWLLGLQNELDFEGFRLSVFSIGSHQISYQPDYLAKTGNAHIAARFFAADTRFLGIRSKEELAFVINGYDVDSEWPKRSKISFLQFFAPEDYQRGRRTADHAEDLWQSFMDSLPSTFPSALRPGALEIPMQHIAVVMESILKDLGSGMGWGEAFDSDGLHLRVERSGICEHLRMVSMPQ